MAENVIDTLKLDIIVNTKQNGQSITTLRKSLEKLYKFLNGVKDQDFSKVSNDIAKIGNSLTPLVNAVNSLDGQGLKNLTSLGTRLKTLSEKMSEVNAAEFAKKMQTMTTAITPFVDKVVSAEGALRELNKALADYKTISSNIPKFTPIPQNRSLVATPPYNGFQESIPINLGDLSVNKKSISGYKTFNTLRIGGILAKLYFIRNITKQLGENLAKVVQYGIDYEETLNLWQVAMKGNTAEARKFITEMNRAYGVSEAMLMNYQATFKNMLGALGGIKPEDAYGLSEVLTQMALDYASLYNTSIESAMTKFQAVLAGQVRPIRNESGYDITQATLFEVYKDIGGTKSIRQLTETEKRLLRILAVYRQMKDTAFEDMSRTITSTANQARFMSETVKEIATWIGVGANQWLQQSKILIKINAYLLALRELAKSFAFSMDYVEPTGEDNKSAEQKQTDNLPEGAEETADAAEGTADAYKEANKQVDELQRKLLGFDKFQVLTDASTENGSDISLTILEELKKVREEYDKIRKETENVALSGDAEKKIKGAYNILKEWGFVLEDIKDEEGTVIGQQWVKDGKTVKQIFEEIWTTIKGIFTFVGLMTKPWLVLVAAIEQAYWKDEDFRNSVNKMLTQLGGAGLKVFQELAEIFIDIAPILAKIVEGFAGIINWLDEMELLDDVIWLVVEALIAWKIHQSAIKLMDFVNQVQLLIMKLRPLAVTEIPQLSTALLTGNSNMGKFKLGLQNIKTMAGSVAGQLALTTVGIGLFTSGLQDAFAIDASPWQRASGVLRALAGAAFLAAAAFATMHQSWSLGATAIAIGAGILAVTGSIIAAQQAAKDMQEDVEKHANGGLATKGSLFYAGEAGPELVTRTSGGGSTIMNMKQLEDAVARGFVRGFASTDRGYDESDTTEIYIDGQRMFNVFRGIAKRNGYDLVKV